MRMLMFGAVVLAGCGVATPISAGADDGCAARASVAWAAGRARADAFSDGPSCALAVVTLVVRTADGTPVWTHTAPAAQVMIFAGVTNAADMQSRLAEWIAQENSMMPTTAALPDWPQAQESPMSGEFPFYVEDGFTREDYLSVRAAGLPLFCYVQGMESLACVALDPATGEANKIGVQLFPG